MPNARPVQAPNGRMVAHVEIPRTGSTSVRKALKTLHTRHLPAMDMRAMLPHWDAYFSFSVVRHPFERTVAQFLHSSNPEDWKGGFEDWVITRYWNQQRHDLPKQEHQHLWWPCWKWLCDFDGRQIVNQVYRFEDGALEILERVLGINKMPHESYARNRKGDWRYYHTEITRSIIGDEFAGDFARWYQGG